MLLGVPLTAVHLVLVGAFGVALGHAALRRDLAWVLALAVPFLFCADRAGLPTTLIAWGCALFAGGVVALLARAVVQTIGMAGGAALIAAAVLGLGAGTANARYVDLSHSSLHNPPLLGVQMESWLRVVARD